MKEINRIDRCVRAGYITVFVFIAAICMGCGGQEVTSVCTLAKVGSDLSIYSWGVCLDRNLSYTCDVGEEPIAEDNKGHFQASESMVSNEDLARYPLIAELYQGNKVVVTLSSLTGQPEVISPLTTLLRVGKDLDPKRSYAELEKDIVERYRLEDEAFISVLDFTTNKRNALLGKLLVDTDEVSEESVNNLYAIYLDDANADLVGEQFESYILTRNSEVGEDGTAAIPANFSYLLWQQGMDLGVGYNDIDGSILSAAQCIEKDENGEMVFVEGTAPMIETYSFEMVHSKRDLRNLLDVDGKLSLNLSSFNLNAEAEFFRNIELNKNSIYVFAEMEMIFRDYMIKDPRLTLDGYSKAENGAGQINGTIRSNYKDENLEVFRQRCGDRFLNVITTGGRYWGLIEIETKNMADKMDISGKLNLKISKFSLDGDVEIINEELAAYEKVKIYVASRGSPGSVETIGTANEDGSSGILTQFYRNIRTFKENLKELDQPSESGKRDYRKAAYMARFESYEQIADHGLVRGGDVSFEAHCIQGFADLIDDYNDAAHEGQNIIENPHLYEDAFNLQTIQTVNTWLNRIALNKAIVLSLATQCAKRENRVCIDLMWMHVLYDEHVQENIATFPNMELFHLDLPLEIKKAYPQPRIIYPKTCKERKELFSRNLDDEYMLYLGREPNRKFFVYCDGMANKQNEQGDIIDSDPVEYLTLRVTSPSSLFANVRYNFSKNIDYIKGVDTLDENVSAIVGNNRATQTTVYKKLRIHITDTHVAIYPNQDRWFETSEGSFFDENGQPVTHAKAGIASSCSPKSQKGANINLQGTPFRIDVPEKVVFGPVTTDFYEVRYWDQLNWSEARTLAAEKGGHLPTIADSEDNEFYRKLIEDFHLSNGAWLGLKTVGGPMDMVLNDQEDTYQLFRWYPSTEIAPPINYWNWWEGYNWEEITPFTNVCVFMNTDGEWEYTDCTEERPVIVEFKRIVGDTMQEAGSKGQVFDIYLRSKIGGCGSYGNIDGEIVLTYDEVLANNDPWLNDVLGMCGDSEVGTPCGNPSATECDKPDSCDGVGFCLLNHEPSGTTCGDPSDTECDKPDTCDGSGTCLANYAPTGTVCGSYGFCDHGICKCHTGYTGDECDDCDAGFFRLPDGDCTPLPAGCEGVISFNDPILEQVVRDKIGIATGDMTWSDLSAVTSLDGVSLNIQSLGKLQCLTSLTTLDLHGNQILDIGPLASLINLTTLSLGSNQIGDISPLANLVNLEHLYLYQNQIDDIELLANLTNLTNLQISNNEISDVSPLAGLTNLTTLTLDANHIIDIGPLANLVNLTHLSLNNNQISDIGPLASLTNLLNLQLYVNQISDISALAGLTNLNHLRLDSNQISDINPLASLTNLTHLDLSINQISDIGPLTNLTSLTVLFLHQNQISDIGPLAGMNSLVYLRLDSNEIIDIGPLANLTNLTYIRLPQNQISDILPLANLTNLTYLHLTNNQIIDIGPLENLTNLAKLYLWSNQIIDVGSLASLTNLTHLYLERNQISDIGPITDLTNLTLLHIHDNQISDISPLANLITLTDLVLAINQINDIGPLINLVNLMNLNLSANQISDVTPLVNNSGIGIDDVIHLEDNQINCTDQEDNITTLVNRGVVLTSDCP